MLYATKLSSDKKANVNEVKADQPMPIFISTPLSLCLTPKESAIGEFLLCLPG